MSDIEPDPPTGRNRRTLLSTGLGLSAAALGVGAYQSLAPGAQRRPMSPAVRQLFARTLPDAQGRPVALERFRDQTLIINFWATWCPPCLTEMPEFSAAYLRLTRHKIELLGIGLDDASKIADWTTKNPISYPILVAGVSGIELLSDFGSPSGSLPFTVIIGADGYITERITGRIKPDDLLDLGLKATT